MIEDPWENAAMYMCPWIGRAIKIDGESSTGESYLKKLLMQNCMSVAACRGSDPHSDERRGFAETGSSQYKPNWLENSERHVAAFFAPQIPLCTR